MPTKKWLKTKEWRTEVTKNVRPRLAIIEEVLMLIAPKWDAKRKTFVKAMTIAEACEKVDISPLTFRNWRNEDKKIHDYYENVMKARKEMQHSMMKDYALGNVMNVLSGSIKLRPKEIVDISLRYLEKTDSDFNQAIKVETEDKTNPLLSMSRDELTQRIMELSSTLKLNKPYVNTTEIWTDEYASSSPTETSEEQYGESETYWEEENPDIGEPSEGK